MPFNFPDTGPLVVAICVTTVALAVLGLLLHTHLPRRRSGPELAPEETFAHGLHSKADDTSAAAPSPESRPYPSEPERRMVVTRFRLCVKNLDKLSPEDLAEWDVASTATTWHARWMTWGERAASLLLTGNVQLLEEDATSMLFEVALVSPEEYPVRSTALAAALGLHIGYRFPALHIERVAQKTTPTSTAPGHSWAMHLASRAGSPFPCSGHAPGSGYPSMPAIGRQRVSNLFLDLE